MTGTAIVLQGDARNLCLPDESVDLIVTSPPYFALRSYQDDGEHYDGQIGSEATPQDFLEALWTCTEEWMRVLKSTGSVWVNLGDKYAGSGGHNNSGLAPQGSTGQMAGRKVVRGRDATRRTAPDRYNQNAQFEADRRGIGAKALREDAGLRRLKPSEAGVPAKSLMGLPWRYAIGCIDQLGLILRAEVVWSKPNGLPESVTDRVRRSHEQWFHFTKQGRYFSGVDEIREPHSEVSLQRAAPHRANVLAHEDSHEVKAEQFCHPLGKLPGSVWTIPSEPLRIPEWAIEKYDLPDHFAAFPQEWPRRIIQGWSPTGICCECGEGRRSVIEPSERYAKYLGRGYHDHSRDDLSHLGQTKGASSKRHEMMKELTASEYNITGYACKCGTNVAHDTTPAIVLDPFVGTGTVAMVARELGRVGISVDLSHDYCRLARWRIYESGHGVKARLRSEKDAQAALM